MSKTRGLQTSLPEAPYYVAFTEWQSCETENYKPMGSNSV